MRSEYSLQFDGPRCIARRSKRATFGGYAFALGLTIIYYPCLGLFLSLLPGSPSGLSISILMALPIIGLVFWVPRLANVRRSVVMKLDDSYFSVFDAKFLRSRILEVVILPHRSRHRVFITFATGDLQNMVLVAEEHDIEAARGHAHQLARWLDVRISAATSPPPRAIVASK